MIGYVPDEPNLYERLTGIEYLNLVADAHGLSKEERKAQMEIYLHIFGLEGAVRDLVASYSHGMQQKLALTAALLHNRRCLSSMSPWWASIPSPRISSRA